MVDRKVAGTGGDAQKGLDGKDAVEHVACEANEEPEETCDSNAEGWIPHHQRAMLSVPTAVGAGEAPALSSWLQFLISPRWHCQEGAASEAFGASKVPLPTLRPFVVVEVPHPCRASCAGQQTLSWAGLDSARSRRFQPHGTDREPSSSLDIRREEERTKYIR